MSRIRSAGLQGAQDLARLTRPLRTQAGVVAAHAVQQAITCGIPTFTREVVALTIAAKLAERPYLALGLQVGAAVVNVAFQALRHSQMNRHPEIAARAFHGMTETQWNALPPAERTELAEYQQYQARLITQMQLSSLMVNLAVSGTAIAVDRPELVSSGLAGDARNWVYAGLRESLQATFAMTEVVNPRGRSSGGVDSQRMVHMATTYGGATVVANYLQDVLLTTTPVTTNTLAERPLAASRFVVRDAFGNLVTSGRVMHRMGAMVAALRAVANTAVEVIDAYEGARHSAAPANGRQIVNPTHTGVDYARLRDHSPMRIAWNSIGGLPGALLQFMPASPLRSLLGNVGVGIAFGLTYPAVNANYQAAAAVRRHVRTNPPTPAQPETTTAQPEATGIAEATTETPPPATAS